MNKRLLLVDDDKENLKANKRLLSSYGYTVVTAESGEEALEIIKKSRADFAVILMDHHMPGMGGPEAVRQILKLVPNQHILSFSIDGAKEVMRESFLAGVVDCLDKNAENDVLLREVAKLCQSYEENSKTINSAALSDDERSRFISESHMIGASAQTYDLCELTRRVAPSDVTALILGASGTGKEVLARAIHKLSRRSAGPYIAFNIAAEPATLIDSSLFGHKKGSFTGATEDRIGKFQQAHGGTIFIDEIGDFPLDLQSRLLRVIQEREIIPVGSSRAVKVDVRIISATHRNLEQMVEAGTFREDLYYRLNSFILRTTPLSERPADIEPLVAHFTDVVCEQYAFRKRFDAKCLEMFQAHSWPANVRGLYGVVESYLSTTPTNLVTPKDLVGFELRKPTEVLPQTMEEINRVAEEVVRVNVERIIRQNPTQVAAAKALQIAPNALHYVLTKFRLTKTFRNKCSEDKNIA